MQPSVAVLDSNYHDDVTAGLSARWLRWELGRLGVEEVAPSSADVLLVTCSCPQNWRDVKRTLREAKPKRGAKVVLGGAAALAPAVFDPIVDVACVGEGSHWIRTLMSDGYEAACVLPESWVPGETRAVIPSMEFAWEMPPVRSPDGIVRLFASRGCRYRCLFCQTGWETTYRAHPEPERLLIELDAMKRAGHRISIMTNDGAEEAVCRFHGHEFVSMRFDNLKRLMPITRAFTKNVRIGVEGVSERLRTAVGKPVPTDELLSMSAALLEAGVQVRWFFIMGLPGETDADYDELKTLSRECQHISRSFVQWQLHPFMPFPATPLGVLPLKDEYFERIDAFRHWFYTGTAFSRRVQQVRQITGYKTRLDHSMSNMAATEAELRRGWFDHDNPNWRIQYQQSPDRLRNMARAYSRRVGLND